MKKICIQLVILVLLLFSSIGLSAQLLISEQFDTGIPVSVKRYFDSSNYMQICENSSQKVFVKNRSVNQDFQKRERENIVTLSINLDFDPLEFYLSWGYIMIFNELGYSGDAFYEGFNQINIQVPEGNYDIMTEFVSLISGASHIVIKEQEAVMGDTEISLNPNDADNYIAIIALDENGEMLQPGIENPNNGAPSMLLFDRAIRFNSTGLMNTTSYFWSFPYMGSIPWNFYINDVSDRYSIIHSLIGFNYEMGDYITKYETLSGISDNISISNNPEDYISHIAKFQPSKIGLDEVYAGFLTIGVFNGDINSFFGTWELSYPDDPMDLNEGIKLFLNNTLDNNPAQVMVLPTITELTTEGGDDFFIKGSPICLDEYGYVLYGSGDISFGLEEGLILGGENYYLTENFSMKCCLFIIDFLFHQRWE